MTAIQFILIVILALVILVGLFILIRSFKRRQDTDVPVVNYDKNGIPIIPRHERNIVDQKDFDDTVAGETTIAPNRKYLNAVVETKPLLKAQKTTQPAEDSTAQPSSHSDSATQQPQGTSGDDDDAFSSLMSATDNIMPAVDIAEEPSFTDNSPILDQHLIESEDEAQNGPLIHAKDNINITILPNQYRDRPASVVRGRDLLALIDKYGLRFGAMNMFHRYENKDGTGMLWFSMMGITDNGIAPFDPHSVATNTYNGVVVFLSLPHPHALMSFDGMMSIAYMMANDLNAMLLDENNEPITPEYKQQLRNQVRDYQG